MRKPSSHLSSARKTHPASACSLSNLTVERDPELLNGGKSQREGGARDAGTVAARYEV